MSSRVKSLKSWDAARCSDGKRFGLQVISSRKAIVCDRRPSSCSKSWKCFETQCLKNSVKICRNSNTLRADLKPQNIQHAHRCWRTDDRLFSIPCCFYLGRFIARVWWCRRCWKRQIQVWMTATTRLAMLRLPIAKAAAAVDVLLLNAFTNRGK
jgi:hypothetical protein